MSIENNVAAPRQTLSVTDACAMIVGLIVGAGIFGTPSIVAGAVGDESTLYAVWIAGGILSIIGALCYAELATTYPRSGGDYHYLTQAFGRWVGFLFGWAQLAVILTGSIGAMAYAFADYGAELWEVKASTSAAAHEAVQFAVFPNSDS